MSVFDICFLSVNFFFCINTFVVGNGMICAIAIYFPGLKYNNT